MRARDRMRQEADRRLQQEAIAEALGERRGYGAPLFIRDEMANGWAAAMNKAPTARAWWDVHLQSIGDEFQQALLPSEAGWGNPVIRQRFKEPDQGWETNAVHVRPDPDPAPALPAELWDKLIGPPLVDVGPDPDQVLAEAIPCAACGGSGYGDSWDGSAYWTCPDCSGTGSAEPPLFDMEPPTTGETND